MNPRVLTLACIVEGHGEAKALPALLHRIARDIQPAAQLRIPEPIRVPRHRIVKPGEFERFVELAARKAGSGGAVLTLLDADDDCPAHLGPHLLQRAQAARSDRRMAVVLANREYEAWFLAGATSLRGLGGLPEALEPPALPESPRDAKGWLTRQMSSREAYDETQHQLEFSQRLDIAAARAADSFDKLWRDMAGLLASQQ